MRAAPLNSKRLEALKFIVRPVVRFCVRSSCSLQDLIAVAKETFVEFAEEELKKNTAKVNVSRLSVLTGIRRAEVERLLAHGGTRGMDQEPQNILMRVMGQWRNDRQFCGRPGEPKALTFKGKNAEFRRLCGKISATINPGTVLFEFERRGFVERKDDKLVLLYRQIPLASFPEAGLKVLSNDLCSTIDAVEENLFRPAPITNLHLRTEFDRIAPRFVPTIRRWLLDEGKEFHRKARNFLAQFDKDLNPEMAKEEGEIEVSVTASSYTPPAKEWS